MEVLRQLPQDRAQPPGVDQRLDALVEARDPLAEVLQPPDVSQISARLDRKQEPRRSLCDPVGDAVPARQPVEGRVDLDRVKFPCVALEPASPRLPLGVQASAPVIVVPARAADAYRL